MNLSHRRRMWPLRWLCTCGHRWAPDRHQRVVDLAGRSIAVNGGL